MASGYTTIRHQALHNVTGYIYENDEGAVFAGVKDDAVENVEWFPAADRSEAERLVTEALTEIASEEFATAGAYPSPPPPYQQPYQQPQYQQPYPYPQYQQPYQQPQYQQPYQPSQYPQYPQPQYRPPQQPYQMTQADRRKAEKKARNKAIRDAVWEELKDSRARKALEKACLRHPCPECSSGRNVRCVSIHGRNTLPAPHVSRIEQYQRIE